MLVCDAFQIPVIGRGKLVLLLKNEPFNCRFAVRVVKLITFLLLVGCLQVWAKVQAQEKITLSVNNAPLDWVLNSIKSQTNYSFFYRSENLKGKTVTLNVTNATLKDVLDIALKNQALTYSIIGNNV